MLRALSTIASCVIKVLSPRADRPRSAGICWSLRREDRRTSARAPTLRLCYGIPHYGSFPDTPGVARRGIAHDEHRFESRGRYRGGYGSDCGTRRVFSPRLRARSVVPGPCLYLLACLSLIQSEAALAPDNALGHHRLLGGLRQRCRVPLLLAVVSPERCCSLTQASRKTSLFASQWKRLWWILRVFQRPGNALTFPSVDCRNFKKADPLTAQCGVNAYDGGGKCRRRAQENVVRSRALRDPRRNQLCVGRAGGTWRILPQELQTLKRVPDRYSGVGADQRPRFNLTRQRIRSHHTPTFLSLKGERPWNSARSESRTGT